MKVTIDTKEDSPEDIRKVVAMLSTLVGKQEIQKSGNIFDDPSPSIGGGAIQSEPEPETPTPTNAFANMFGGEQTTTPEPSETQEEEKEEVEENAEIIPY